MGPALNGHGDAPGASAQNFATGDGGWTAAAQYDGLCVPVVTCPSVSGAFVAANGGNGGGSNGGSGVTTTNQLSQLILSGGLPSSAKLRGNKLRLKVKCPKNAAPLPCRYKLQGLSKGRKSKPATKRKGTKIKAGKAKKVVIKVKPKFLAKYRRAKKVYVKAKVSVGSVKTTVTKKLKLIH